MRPKSVLPIFLLLILSRFFLSAAIPASERAALIALYKSTNGDSWAYNSGWKTPPLDSDGFAMPGTEGNWYGVYLDSSHVSKIYLNWNRLHGGLPAALGNMIQLQILSLKENQLSGNIPNEIGALTGLSTLDLNNNQLNGTIPPELGNLAVLTVLDLSGNRLNGSIPIELGKLTYLTTLDLSGNQLSGAIPSELGNLKYLEWLDFSYNQLCGSIPIQFGSLKCVEWLSLACNQLSGSIPTELAKLKNLSDCYFTANQLSGSIPVELGSLENLSSLGFGANQLSGSIPGALGNAKKLDGLFLWSNRLSGPIPVELGQLTSLTYLELDNNQLNGTIPKELGNLVHLTQLGLKSNQLSGTIPVELGNLTELTYLRLENNQLTGLIPASLVNLKKLYVDSYSDYNNGLKFEYNGLYTDDSSLISFLDVKKPDWSKTQTIPPKNVSVIPAGASGVILSWAPITYNRHSGGYRIYYVTVADGSCTFYGQTTGKSVSSMGLYGLAPNLLRYFMIRTRTDAHDDQLNLIDSEYSNPVFVTQTRSDIRLSLTGTRKLEKAWLSSLYYGEIQVTLNNPEASGVSAYVVLHRTGGGLWQLLNKVAPASIQNGRFVSYDKGLLSDGSYSYFVVAVDASGMVLARSEEITI
jgi:Leucine-rich repeat (LRR) protein